MTKILFVCHGNICRSPMAEFVMKDIVKKRGIEKEFEIASCATSTEEIGNSVYPPVKKKLKEVGILCDGKTARQLTREDYDHFDYIIAMDRFNIKNMKSIIGDDKNNKVFLLMDFTDRPGEVADPWYTRDFDATYRDVKDGCEGLLKKIIKI